MINETYLTVQNNCVYEPPCRHPHPHGQFQPPSTPSLLSQGLVPPSLPIPSPADWMAQMLLDRTVPPGPLPLTNRTAWGLKPVFWRLFPSWEELLPCLWDEQARRGGWWREKEAERLEDTPLFQQDKQHGVGDFHPSTGSMLKGDGRRGRMHWGDEKLRRRCNWSFWWWRLKMRVGVLLLRVSWFFVGAEISDCKEMPPVGTGLHQRSKSHFREHARHKHQQPYYRNTSLRRKGESTSSPPAERVVRKRI